MTAILKTIKCRNCGHEYPVLIGGFILKTTPTQCPNCGSTNSKLPFF